MENFETGFQEILKDYEAKGHSLRNLALTVSPSFISKIRKNYSNQMHKFEVGNGVFFRTTFNGVLLSVHPFARIRTVAIFEARDDGLFVMERHIWDGKEWQEDETVGAAV